MSILMSITFQPPFSMKRASKKENELNQMKLLSFYTLFLKNSLHALNFGKIKVLKKFLKKTQLTRPREDQRILPISLETKE